MRAANGKFRWEFLMIALLIGIDVLVGLRIVQRVILRQGEISPDAPFFLVLLLLLQVSVIVVFTRWNTSLKEHQRLRESYEQELALSRQIMENDEGCIMVMDVNGRYTHANRAACELLGLPLEDIIGRFGSDFMFDPTSEEHREVMRVNLTHTVRVPVMIRRSNGESVRMMVRVAPRWHGNLILGAISYAHPSADLAEAPTLSEVDWRVVPGSEA